jgi:hypothetical protein
MSGLTWRRSARADAWLSAGLLLLACVSYAWVLRLPLTAIDTIPTIAAAEVDSIAEVPGLFVRELRAGVGGDFAYYRPITLITYSLDLLLHGWEPLGYHVTDLILHALATLSVYWMARLAFGCAPGPSLLVSLVFVLHSAAVEVVPAVARRQEPLLVTGLCLALIGAARLPARGGWWILVGGTALAMGSVERGVIVAPVVLVFLLLRPGVPGGVRGRLRQALLRSLPCFAVVLGFMAFRNLLYGTDEILFHPINLLLTPYELLRVLVYPQQIIELRVPRTIPGLVGGGLLAAGTAAAGLWVLLRTRLRWLIAFVFLTVMGYGVLLGIAGQRHSWYTYSVVPVFGLLLVLLGLEAWGDLRRGKGRAGAAVQLALCGAVLLPILISSPVFRDYPGWRVAGELGERFTAELQRVDREVPPGVALVIVNLPAHYMESDHDYLVTRSAAILWPRSVEVWSELHGISRPVVLLGAAELVGSLDVPEVRFPARGRVEIYFPAGGAPNYVDPENTFEKSHSLFPQAQGREFVWPPVDVLGKPFRLFVFDGTRLQPREAPEALPDGSEQLRDET